MKHKKHKISLLEVSHVRVVDFDSLAPSGVQMQSSVDLLGRVRQEASGSLISATPRWLVGEGSEPVVGDSGAFK